MVRVDLRTVVLDVPTQDVISRDNVSVKVNAVVYFRVVDPREGDHPGRELPRRDQPAGADDAARRCSASTSSTRCWPSASSSTSTSSRSSTRRPTAWGIKVTNVEIKQVDLNESMIRAIARQAEAERERRAKVIHAEGELQASEKLLAGGADAGAGSRRRCSCAICETLTVIAADKNSTIVFPLPMDLITPFLARRAAESQR